MADKSRGFILHAIKRCRARRQTLFSFLLTLVAKRRRQLIELSLILLVLRGNIANLATARSVKRSCRRLKRNIGWWKTVSSTYSASRFKKTFRISRATFDFILEKIRHRLQRETKSKDPISPEERLAICLYRLARGDYYFTISEMVGRGLSTVSSIVHEVCEAIVEEMWDSSVSCHIPTTEDDFKDKILDTEELWQFPCCWAAIDGCHIPIKCPDGGLEACKEYHNFKNFYSIVLMGLVELPNTGLFGLPVDFLVTTMIQSFSNPPIFGIKLNRRTTCRKLLRKCLMYLCHLLLLETLHFPFVPG